MIAKTADFARKRVAIGERRGGKKANSKPYAKPDLKRGPLLGDVTAIGKASPTQEPA